MADLINVLTEDGIEKIVSTLARKISSDYEGKDLVCVGVLKGAFIFMADLVRLLTIPLTVEFLRASSYGSGTVSSGRPELSEYLSADIRGKDVLLVEDIIDTGLTLERILGHLKNLHPNSIRVCALIDKRERRQVQIPIDYAGHVTHSGFLVGFGLDHAEAYRNLPGIFQLNP
jgi:hypoxanthine phosphoribosyltransferase